MVDTSVHNDQDKKTYDQGLNAGILGWQLALSQINTEAGENGVQNHIGECDTNRNQWENNNKVCPVFPKLNADTQRSLAMNIGVNTTPGNHCSDEDYEYDPNVPFHHCVLPNSRNDSENTFRNFDGSECTRRLENGELDCITLGSCEQDSNGKWFHVPGNFNPDGKSDNERQPSIEECANKNLKEDEYTEDAKDTKEEPNLNLQQQPSQDHFTNISPSGRLNNLCSLNNQNRIG